MSRPRAGRRRDGAASSAHTDSLLAARLTSVEIRYAELANELDELTRSQASSTAVRTAYRRLNRACQEPLPSLPSAKRRRAVLLNRELSRLRTIRQWHLLDRPPGALLPTGVRTTTRAALGPHIAGLEFDTASPTAQPFGVDLATALEVRIPQQRMAR